MQKMYISQIEAAALSIVRDALQCVVTRHLEMSNVESTPVRRRTIVGMQKDIDALERVKVILSEQIESDLEVEKDFDIGEDELTDFDECIKEGIELSTIMNEERAENREYLRTHPNRVVHNEEHDAEHRFPETCYWCS